MLTKTVLLVCFVVGVCSPAFAQTYFDVPAPYPTIQAAINAATPGSIVRIAAGTYTGLGNRDLDPQGKSITIQGQSAATTIIDCQGAVSAPHRGFSITSGSAALIIEHLTITNGHHARGAAMDIWSASPTVQYCVFESCAADNRGGGVALVGTAAATFDDCAFSQCSAGTNGGAVSVESDGHPVFTGCSFTSNMSAFQGGAVFCGTYPASFQACTFTSNFSPASSGGAFWMAFGAAVTLTACDLTGNSALQGGGAIRCESSQLSLVNSILWGNTPGSIDGSGGGAITGSHCDIDGGYAGAGNIAADPLFLNAAAGDYRLGIASPAIDAGDSLAVPVTLVADLDGNPRIVGPAVDMGSDEYAPFHPGTGDDLLLTTAVNGNGAGTHLLAAPAGSYFDFSMTSPGGSMIGALGLVVANYFPTMSPPTPTPGVSGLHVDIATVLVLVDVIAPPPFGTTMLTPSGIQRSYVVPPGLGGFSLRLQGAALSPLAMNGAFAITDAQTLNF